MLGACAPETPPCPGLHWSAPEHHHFDPLTTLFPRIFLEPRVLLFQQNSKRQLLEGTWGSVTDVLYLSDATTSLSEVLGHSPLRSGYLGAVLSPTVSVPVGFCRSDGVYLLRGTGEMNGGAGALGCVVSL